MRNTAAACAGVVYPMRGPLDKEAGRRLARFGPLTGWSVDLTAKQPVVRPADPHAACCHVQVDA